MSNYSETRYMNSIAIIGMSCRFPQADNYKHFWQNIVNGFEPISDLSDDDIQALGVSPDTLKKANYVKRASLLEKVDHFDANFFDFTAREASITAPVQRLTLMCAHEAIEDASYSLDTMNRNVGVFIGVNRCDEWQKRLYELSRADEGEFAKQLQLYIANDLDYAATRISYKFNLKGPSFNVSTACSTSLVSIHQACRSLQSFECDLALAGGGNVITSLDKGYIYEPDGIQSNDGHCRAFDDSSSGTIFGNGIGIVLLKRLEEAVADGDYIHGIIRGTAINNDGGAKVGYTAPSVTGQANVISAAMAMSEVNANEIGYVESHGTGTRLGDPIEIEALTRAYRKDTDNNQYCALGSVKTNIGHLGSAAGVAGFIKAVETVKNGEIAPSLHFKKANSEIEFDKTPFYIATERKPWSDAGGPRISALSSFGVGGTNAHAIIEQAKVNRKPSSHRNSGLFLVSAKSQGALRNYCNNIANYLADCDSDDLANVEYSLNTGRQQFDYRAFVVGDQKEQLQNTLRNLTISDANFRFHLPADTVGHNDQYTAFLFPGQGSQYVDMARGVYQTEPVFKQHFDKCCDLFFTHTKLDLRKLIFIPADVSETEREQAATVLTETDIAQPALFSVEYAFTKLLEHWGIFADKMIGHSIGEYVAACVSGVFSLEDAVQLVANRARLMASMDPGRMLAVPLSEKVLRPYLNGCDIAIVNGPEWCVASGSENQIAALEQALAKQDVKCRKLFTSHAFHSHMMEPLLDEFRRQFKNIKLQEPTIPIVSNVTGNWLTKGQATDPEYWVRQLRGTVQFYAGAQTLTESGSGVLIEVGPGQTLTGLIRGIKTSSQKTLEISICRQARQEHDDQAFLLTAIGQLWQTGIGLDFDAFYQHDTLFRVPLPTYPFELNQYGLKPATQNTQAGLTIAVNSEMETNLAANTSPVEQMRASDDSFAWAVSFIASNVKALFGVDEIDHSAALIEMGLTSLMAIEMRTLLNNTAQQDIISIVDLLDENANIENIARQLVDAMSGQASNTVSSSTGAAVITLEQRAGKSNTTDIVDPSQENIAPVFDNVNREQIKPALENVNEPFPLTDIQQAYWIGRHSGGEGGDVATYAYLEIELDNLDVIRYENALNKLVQRHHMLRMVVQEDGQQRFLPEVPHYNIPCEDLSELPAKERDQILEDLRTRMSHQILDVAKWPLFEVKINRLPNNVYRLHWGFDFMIVDVLSLLVFFRDMFLIYAGEDSRLSPLELSFRDYVLYETKQKSSNEYKVSKDYWLKRVKTLPAAPQLPTTCAAETIIDPRYSRRDFTLDEATWSRLKAVAKANKLTPSVVVATAFSEVLTKWCEAPDFTLNMTIFNRPNLHPQMNDLIGDFTSSVLLEVDMRERRSFLDAAKLVRNQLMEDLEHRHFNGVEVLRALNSQSGGYQSVIMPIVLTSALGLDQYSESKLDGISEEKLDLYHKMMDLGHTISQTSQVWLDHVVREKDGILYCNWDALEQLFPEGVLDDMFCAYYDRLIDLANNGEQAWNSAGDFELPMEQSFRREQVNNTAKPENSQLLHELFEQTANTYPDNIALYNRGYEINYRTLRTMALQLSDKLLSVKTPAKSNELVAIIMEKGWEQIAAVYGILYSGAAYLPIDATLPPDRIEQILVEGNASTVLTQEHLVKNNPWPTNIEVITINEAFLNAAKVDSDNVDQYKTAQQLSNRDLAYVLFTSGSTGKPKGVMVSHHAVVNTVLDVNERFTVTESDRVIAINALNFDLSVYDVFGALSCGAALAMPDYQRAFDAKHWLELVTDHAVSVWNTVPAIVQLFIDQLDSMEPADAQQQCQSLRYFMMSGDWIPVELARRIQKVLPEVSPISLGGPTETTVWSIFYPIETIAADWKSIPYGKPLSNRKHIICRDDFTDCPDWVTGEILTGGPVGVAEGYWNDEERTNNVFVSHPLTGERFYKTGDLGRFLPDGNIEFIGRKDFQVKIQGHRIELGEIEHLLYKCEGVKNAVALAINDANPESNAKNKLVAFVEEEKEVSLSEFLENSKILTNPAEIALFKMEQHGINRFASDNIVKLPSKPKVKHPLTISATSLKDYIGANPEKLDSPITKDALGQWLAPVAQVPIEGYSLPKYFYPSAGSSHAVQLYFAVGGGGFDGLPEGVYYYNSAEHALYQITHHSDAEPNPITLLAHTNDKVVLYTIMYVPAVESLYGQEGERVALLEAGHMANLLTASGSQVGIGFRQLADAGSSNVLSQLQLNDDYQIIDSYTVFSTPVPDDSAIGTLPLDVVARQSYRTFEAETLTHSAFSSMMEHCEFNAPTTASYLQQHIRVYVYVKPGMVEAIEGGFYRLDYATGKLELIETVDTDHTPENFQYKHNANLHREAAFTLLFTTQATASDCWKDALVATGFLAQAFQNVSTLSGIGICCTAGAKRDVTGACFNFENDEKIIYCLEGGKITEQQSQVWTTESMQDHTAEPELIGRCRKVLQTKLPYYMVPSQIIALEDFPLSANGKVNRRALAAIFEANQEEGAVEIEFVAPTNNIEEQLVEIWKSILHLEEVSTIANLFELGGDSLVATTIITEIKNRLGVSVSLHKLFADPRIVALASEIADKADSSDDTAATANDLLMDYTNAFTRMREDAVLNEKYYPRLASQSKYDSSATALTLVTGATGYLGAFVLAELLDSTATDIVCLARASADMSAHERVYSNLKKHGLWKDTYLERTICVEGDLSQPQLGLSPEIYQHISESVDAIYHVGAQVNYARAYQDICDTNVNGMNAIIELAGNHKIKPVTVISTKYVCFALTEKGETHYPEEAGIENAEGMFIGYTQSKWVIEKLAQQAAEQGIPMRIVRPGQITAAARGTVSMPVDAFHHLLRLFRQANTIPDHNDWPNGVIDVMPADLAAKAIVTIGQTTDSALTYYNLVSPEPLSIKDFFEIISNSCDQKKAVVPFEQWSRECLDIISSMEDKTVAFVIERFFITTEHGQFIQPMFRNAYFQTKNAEKAMGKDLIKSVVDHKSIWSRYTDFLKSEEISETLVELHD